MNWIKNHLAASVLFAFVAVAALLFATGKLRWSSPELRSSPESSNSEHGEAAEKKVKQGKVVLDAEDFKASGVEISEVKEGNVGETLQSPGEVQPMQTRRAEVTPPISGIVRAIHKIAGDSTSAGGTLCTIESAELGSIRAELEAALAEREVTHRSQERLKELYEKGLRSQTEVWAAEADYNKARLRAEAASAHIRAVGLDTSSGATAQSGLSNRYELRSPINGIVLQQQLTIGQNVEQKDVLFTVADLSTVWVSAAIQEKDVTSIHKGTTALINLQGQDGSPTSMEGVVDYISQQQDQQTRTVPVRITVKNRVEGRASQGNVLRPGMFTTVRFITSRRAASLAVPATALQELNGQTIVFVEVLAGNSANEESESKEDGQHSKQLAHTFEPRAVTVGVSDGKLTEIAKGLKPGEKVVVRNAFLLKSELEKEKIGDDE